MQDEILKTEQNNKVIKVKENCIKIQENDIKDQLGNIDKENTKSSIVIGFI